MANANRENKFGSIENLSMKSKERVLPFAIVELRIRSGALPALQSSLHCIELQKDEGKGIKVSRLRGNSKERTKGRLPC